MMKENESKQGSISRRQFLVTGGAAAAAGGLTLKAGAETSDKPNIVRHRTLGRTGFEASDVSIGGVATESNIYRYAYDRGINYFDTGERYGGGASERAIGEALQHMDRKKVFITTKIEIKNGVSENELLDRFGKCQERLRTDYVDSLFMHGVDKVETLANAGFHSAVKRLKADGRVRFAGVSSHGPIGTDGDSMGDVLVAAADDGRFDLMLIAYNYLNREEGDRVLKACKRHNVGTTAMKTAPGTMDLPPFDPDNLSDIYLHYIKEIELEGYTREEAIHQLKAFVDMEIEAGKNSKGFMDKHGLSSKEELRDYAVKWVLSNPEMHTVCMGCRDFDSIDRFVPLSGTKLAQREAVILDQFRVVNSSRYCRHGCVACVGSCPHLLPVSTIMRYAYYFTEQGREKQAMEKYARLQNRVGAKCAGCAAPCLEACPHGVDVRANLIGAHGTLTLA